MRLIKPGTVVRSKAAIVDEGVLVVEPGDHGIACPQQPEGEWALIHWGVGGGYSCNVASALLEPLHDWEVVQVIGDPMAPCPNHPPSVDPSMDEGNENTLSQDDAAVTEEAASDGAGARRWVTAALAAALAVGFSICASFSLRTLLDPYPGPWVATWYVFTNLLPIGVAVPVISTILRQSRLDDEEHKGSR